MLAVYVGFRLSRGVPIKRKAYEPRKDGPFRISVPESRNLTIERRLLEQVKAIRKKEEARKVSAKALRKSPRKPLHSSTMISDNPILSSTRLDCMDIHSGSTKPKNAYEMLKEASDKPKEKTKKFVKKMPKKTVACEESSLFEDDDSSANEELAYNGVDRKESKTAKKRTSDKENSEGSSPLKTSKIAVSRVYRRKKEKPGVSFEQSVQNLRTPKKETKKVSRQT